jgi:hypothetical protein
MLFPLATRVQAVTLKNCGYSYENIEKLTGIKKRQLQYIIDEAKKRGYNPQKLTRRSKTSISTIESSPKGQRSFR